MAWDNQQPPWGQRKGGKTPEEQLGDLINKIKKFFAGGSQGGGSGGDSGKSEESKIPRTSPGTIATVIGAGLVVVFLLFSFYAIRPGEQGVVLRLGQYSHTTNPGLNFRIPLVDVVHRVDMETVRREQFGFRTRVVDGKTQHQKQGFTHESLMLTSDRNVIDMEWVVQYRVDQPFNFLFRIRDVPQAVRDVSEMTMRRLVGNMDFDEVLAARAILANNMAYELQKILNYYESGVRIITVQLQDVNPPEAVKPAFNDVNVASQDMKRVINEAEEIFNREVPRARGQARQVIEEAHGYKIERVNRAVGATTRFNELLVQYERAPGVTRQRLYIETMRAVLPQVTEVIVIDSDLESVLPMLPVAGAR